jgi:hypothetical protein
MEINISIDSSPIENAFLRSDYPTGLEVTFGSFCAERREELEQEARRKNPKTAYGPGRFRGRKRRDPAVAKKSPLFPPCQNPAFELILFLVSPGPEGKPANSGGG